MKIDLTGKKYGRLTVLYEADRFYSSKGKPYRAWRCLCECGNEKTILQASLQSGNTKSCGCGCEENKRKILNRKGVSRKDYTPHKRLEATMNSMRQRCYNQNNLEYHRYGGRGITICDEWMDKKDGMKNFVLWALDNGYSDELTIDRIDNDKGYSPDNCRWADRFTQMSNTSVAARIPYKGGIYSYVGLSRVIGESAHSITKWYKRGYKTGEEIIKAIEQAKRDYPQTVKYYGQKRTIKRSNGKKGADS